MPRGAGTGLSGGAIPVHGGVLIVLTRMNRILDIDLPNRMATVEAGCVNLAINRAVMPHGFFFAPDPASQQASTIGGNVAENAGGPHCLKYGATTNHVLGARSCFPTARSSAFGGRLADRPGYDLLGVFVGSEGTLGICTEVTVRLLPLPQAVKTILAVFRTIEDASNAVSAIIARGIIPVALEMIDQETTQAVEAYVKAGYPLDAGAVLLIELEGLQAEIATEAVEVEAACRAHACLDLKVAQTEEERALLWKGRKSAAGAFGRMTRNYYHQDAVVPRTKLAAVLREIAAIGARYGVRVPNVFHAGDGNIHPLLCYDARVPGQFERAMAAGDEIMRCCIRAGGTVSGEHGIGVEKREYLRLMYSDDDLAAMQRIQQVLDPRGRCNPGKIFPEAGTRRAGVTDAEAAARAVEALREALGADERPDGGRPGRIVWRAPSRWPPCFRARKPRSPGPRPWHPGRVGRRPVGRRRPPVAGPFAEPLRRGPGSPPPEPGAGLRAGRHDRHGRGRDPAGGSAAARWARRPVLAARSAAGGAGHARRDRGRQSHRSAPLPVRDRARPGPGRPRGARRRHDHQGGGPGGEERDRLRPHEAVRGLLRHAGDLLEATLRLQPRPAVERGWVLTGATIEQCHDAAMRILGSHLAPNRVELLDEACAEACGISRGGSALVVSFAGVGEAVQDQGESVRTLAGELGLRAAEIENPAAQWRALQDFPWAAQGSGSSAVRVLWRGSVLPSDGGKAMHAVRDATSGHGDVAIAATVSHGVLRGALRASTGDRAARGVAAAREALTALGGFLVVLEAPDALRATLDVGGPCRPRSRDAADPDRLRREATLNPGRFLDGM